MIKLLPIVILTAAIAGFLYFGVVSIDAFILINVALAVMVILLKLSQATIRQRKASEKKEQNEQEKKNDD